MYKIDIVYLWVDGSDETWTKAKNKTFAEVNNKLLNPDAIDSYRFQDNDELLYSLRSLEKNCPFVNHVYIVTANQTPKWLNLSHEKITLVSHDEIMDSFALPSFNVAAIESYITKIPNLNEHFIFANDDTFFWNETRPEFFFDANGNPLYRMRQKIVSKKYKHLYGFAVSRANNLVKNRFHKAVDYFPHHGIDPYRKSYVNECLRLFKEEFDVTRHNHFRDWSDLQRSIFAYYAIVKKGCRFKIAPKEGYVKCRKREIKKLYESDYSLACINGGRNTKEADIREMKKLLAQKFPHISSFENKEEIDVCFASDNSRCISMAASISSILQNKKPSESINIYIIDNGINTFNKERFKSFEEKYDCQITFLLSEGEAFKETTKKILLPKNTDYALLIPSLIQSKRVIYLDCDTIITSSLKELFCLDFKGSLVLGVASTVEEKHICDEVLLINAEQMRKENTAEHTINWSDKNRNSAELHKQNLLNSVISSKFSYMDKKFNVQIGMGYSRKYSTTLSPVVLSINPLRKINTLCKLYDRVDFEKKYCEALSSTPWRESIRSLKTKPFLRILPPPQKSCTVFFERSFILETLNFTILLCKNKSFSVPRLLTTW